MRISGLVYLTLFVYPIITVLIPDPAVLGWLLRTGGLGTIPSEIKLRGERNRGNVLLLKFALLITASLILMRIVPVAPSSLGLGTKQPMAFVFIGLPVAALVVYFTYLMKASVVKISSRTEVALPFLLHESTSKLILILVIGGFAEEFWRALTITVFHQADISDIKAIIFSSIIFGVGHLFSYRSFGAALGKVLPPAIGGALLGTLFLLSQTLFIPFVFHVLINSIGALLGRRRLIVKQGSKMKVGQPDSQDVSESDTYSPSR